LSFFEKLMRVVNVTLQFMSDLHLELFPGFRIADADVRAERLVLAGDIGDPQSSEYAEFVADCVAKFPLGVFVVMGNHEAYGKPSWEHAVAAARQVLEARGAVLLDKSGVDLVPGKLRIIGATLWSRVHGYDANDVRTFIADYHMIGGMRGVCDSNALHDADMAWLRAELDLMDAEGVRAVVVTHHAPSLRGTSHPKHAGSSLNCAFATDLDHLVGRPSVAAWIYGHTHYSAVQRLHGGALLASNQRGYADNPEEVGLFDPSRTLSLGAF
jgi:predicted phosphodiesterase